MAVRGRFRLGKLTYSLPTNGDDFVDACRQQRRRFARGQRMPRDVVVVVVIDPEEIDRLVDGFQVPVLDDLPEAEPLYVAEQIRRVGAAQDRVEEHPVPQRIDAAGCFDVRRVVRIVGHGVGEVQGDADFPCAELAQAFGRQAVCKVLVVHGCRGRARFRRPGACSPAAYPMSDEQSGSLNVVQWATLSPSAPWTASA